VSFVKLHGTILDSSVWQEPAATRLVWITMLAMANQDGVVEASVGGLAHRARVSRAECEAALACFLGPDPDSRDGTSGERITEVPGGWLVLNHCNYRDMRTREQVLTAERVARHREKQRSNKVTERNAPPVSASASASEIPERGSRTPRPEDVPEQTWNDWLAHRKAKHAGISTTAVEGIRREAVRAGLSLDEALQHSITQGWQGFRARWLESSKSGALPPRLVAMSTQHIPNMPLGAASCECPGCREFRSKRAAK